jgi:hypothetical protein
VAIALAEGAELTQASSDMVLKGARLDSIASAREIAQRTLAIVRQNQRWALYYNLSAVPLAALGFVPPWLAALGMSLSSLGVILNALRIGRGAQRPASYHRRVRGSPTGRPHEHSPAADPDIAVVPAGAAWLFFWAVDDGQFDDLIRRVCRSTT